MKLKKQKKDLVLEKYKKEQKLKSLTKKKFNFISSYSYFIVNFPIIILLLTLLITGYGFTLYDNLITKNPSVDEILPSNLDVTQSLKKLIDNLVGGDSSAFMIVIELEPEIGSKINDLRNPVILKYISQISNQILMVEDVTSIQSLDSLISNFNSGYPTNNLIDNKIIFEKEKSSFSRIINDKFSLTVIRIYANQGYDVEILLNEIQKIIDNNPTPLGIKVQMSGESIANKISEDLTNPDSQKTTMISLFAIILILLITFRSPIYTILPLFTIIFGVLWTFGFLAGAGIAQSNFTAGAMSMIIGIGIDFGIQIIMRYRQELASANPVLAMENTLENVLKPMFITTVAAFIGFWAMTLGDFLVLGELGKIMAIGVVFCFLAAITIVPVISVIYEKVKYSLKNKNIN